MPGSDTTKLIFTYTIAAIIIVGGGLMIFATRLDPPESDVAGLRLLLAGFIGAATTFVFTSETATRASRAAESAHSSAAYSTERALTQGTVNAQTIAQPLTTLNTFDTTTTTTDEWIATPDEDERGDDALEGPPEKA